MHAPSLYEWRHIYVFPPVFVRAAVQEMEEVVAGGESGR